ncbi:hypothetical protein AAMO2058_000201900 [Amorphochlora amoebiformis]
MSFVCGKCNFVISSTEERDVHYKSYWHRYNVKRTCEGLHPVSYEVFQKKLAVITKGTKEEKKETLRCDICKKTFASTKAHQHHMRSKRHLQKAANRSSPATPALTPQTSKSTQDTKIGQDKEQEETNNTNNAQKEKKEKKQVGVPLAHCLFCGKRAQSVEESLRHMLKAHSFYLPYTKYLISLDAIMLYLGEKIGIGHQCLSCNHIFKDIEAVRQHMRDRGHCKMSFEDEQDAEEYGDFFHVPEKKEEKTKERRLAPNEVEGVASEMNDLGEIVMKDGRVLGHRSLVRYYKQNLKPVDTEQPSLVIKIMRNYRAIGMKGYNGRSKRNEKSRKDVLHANKYFMKIGFKKNKQKHFKDSTAPFN